jgi:hypothetical protein
MDLDGGGATIYSPPIDVSPLFSHQLEADVKTEALKFNEAYLSITFFDADRSYQETYESSRVTEAPDWERLRIGPVMPKNRDIRFAVIGLHLVPTDRSDLYGSAMFDNLCLARLPRMSLSANRDFNIFFEPKDVEITCDVSGTQRNDHVLCLELIDLSGKTLARSEIRMSDDRPTGTNKNGVIRDVSFERLPSQGGFAGTVTWCPPVKEFGYYHVRASMEGNNGPILQRAISFGVARRHRELAGGEFGWSLPRGEQPLGCDELVDLLEITGVTWVKFPVWGSYRDEAARNRIAHFSDRLNALGIEMVGMLDRPPDELQQAFGNKKHLTVAEVFLAPEVWQPAVDPMLIQLALKVRCWQLGLDSDESFIEFAGLNEKVQEIRTHLRHYGQRTRLVMPWQWMNEIPIGENPPWDCLALSTDPAFTPKELSEYVPTLSGSSEDRAECWVNLAPLPKNKYTVTTRVQDLVLRMLMAKVRNVDAVFLPDPFDPMADVLNADGSPAALFLPWRTTVGMISDCEYLGQLVLPNGSQNHVFARGGEAIIAVWNNRPTVEELYLGEDVRHQDLWGRDIPIRRTGSKQIPKQAISVGPLPTFVTGLNTAIARWRLSLQFEQSGLESVFGRQQVARFTVKNTFAQGVGGEVVVQTPDDWDVKGNRTYIKMATNEEIVRDLSVLFHTDASSGPQRLRLDFNLSADKQYRFSVFRDLQVGLGDFTVELNTWLDDNGRLIVEQTLINKTEQRLNFNCLLFVPGRRRLRQQVLDLKPGRVVNAFILDDGDELIGQKLWLRAEEIDGQRLLNFDITAEP